MPGGRACVRHEASFDKADLRNAIKSSFDFRQLHAVVSLAAPDVVRVSHDADTRDLHRVAFPMIDVVILRGARMRSAADRFRRGTRGIRSAARDRVVASQK
jgi:hypothetical protein